MNCATHRQGKLIAVRWREDGLAIINGYAKTHDMSRGEALQEIVSEPRNRWFADPQFTVRAKWVVQPKDIRKCMMLFSAWPSATLRQPTICSGYLS